MLVSSPESSWRYPNCGFGWLEPYHRPQHINQSKRTKSQKAATYLCTNSYGFSSRGNANHMDALGMGVVHEHSLGRRRVRLRDYARFTVSMTKANWKPTGSCVECESIALLVCQVPPFDKYHYRTALLLGTSTLDEQAVGHVQTVFNTSHHPLILIS